MKGALQALEGESTMPSSERQNVSRTGTRIGNEKQRRASRLSPAVEQMDAMSKKMLPVSLAGDSDVASAKAEILVREGRYNEAHECLKSVLEQDSYNKHALTTYLSIAVKLKKKTEIFMLGHKLMEQNPESAEAWYAAGCYYFVTHQYSSARQYFGKATVINKMYAPAWVAFAHSFAALDETDQAMAAYRTASRLFPGLHDPILGMSLEYSKMNNMALAEEMMRLAHKRCPQDPVLLHEMGTLAYKNGRYLDACKLLARVVDMLDQQVTVSNAEVEDVREVSLVNLGHAYRKTREWNKALNVLTRALALEPYQPGTHMALGYTYQLMGKYDEAIEYYHKALGLRPEDPFATSMLATALQESSDARLAALEEVGVGADTAMQM